MAVAGLIFLGWLTTIEEIAVFILCISILGFIYWIGRDKEKHQTKKENQQ